jgi:hypothetical protein
MKIDYTRSTPPNSTHWLGFEGRTLFNSSLIGRYAGGTLICGTTWARSTGQSHDCHRLFTLSWQSPPACRLTWVGSAHLPPQPRNRADLTQWDNTELRQHKGRSGQYGWDVVQHLGTHTLTSDNLIAMDGTRYNTHGRTPSPDVRPLGVRPMGHGVEWWWIPSPWRATRMTWRRFTPLCILVPQL